MKKDCYSIRWHVLSLLFLLLGASCGDDDYHYPDISQDYLTAQSGADGRLETVTDDDGVTLPVLNSVSAPGQAADTTLRIVANYAREEAADGSLGARLYAAQLAVSPVPLPAESFEEGVKNDPASVLSIWLGLDYLNVVLEIKTGGGSHAFHFVEDRVKDLDGGTRREVDVTLYHDAADDPQYYTRRAYLSVPLWPYVADGVETLGIRFNLCNYDGETETYGFDYRVR